MINKVIWDSEQFSLNIGRFDCKEGHFFDVSAFKQEALNYQLVYVFSPIELCHGEEFYLADKKVVFLKYIKAYHNIAGISEFHAEQDNYEKLLELAYLSGSYSRFKSDPDFVNHEFKHLYKTWLDKSISGEMADHILLFKEGSEIAGFVTLKIHYPEKAVIGLIAVSASFQGKHIASKLIEACESLALKAGVQILEVATQMLNLPAMALYEKNQFSIKSIQYIYHYRNP